MTNGDFAVYCIRIAQRASAYASDSMNVDLRDRKIEGVPTRRFLNDMHGYLEWAEAQIEVAKS